MSFFVWRTYHIFVAKLDLINFIKYEAIFNAQLTKWLGVQSFDPPLVKKTNSCWFSRKRVKFELQLPHSLIFILPKIISRYISTYLIREAPKISKIQPLARNGHSRRFDRIFETGIKNSKKIKKLGNLRIVSLYVAMFPGKITNL